jgi:hypothetical protein
VFGIFNSCQYHFFYLRILSNVEKGVRLKKNEAVPAETDVVLEKLITMLNNINSNSKNVH